MQTSNKIDFGSFSRTHGMCRSPEYRVWSDMRRRCKNKNIRNYKNYGGRGITVCERWENSFENFFADMGKRPSNKYSIERNDNNGNYEPSNCKWATRSEQNSNTRNCHYLEFNGLRLTIDQWSKKLSIPSTVLRGRVWMKWPVDRMLTEKPTRKRFGDSNAGSKLKNSQVAEIKEMLALGIGRQAIADKFNVKYSYIRNIHTGRSRSKDGQVVENLIREANF